MKKKVRRWSPLLFILIGLLFVAAINIISSYAYKRFDLTSEKRYILSPATIDLLKGLDDYVYFKVFLTGEDMPAGFQRLRNETREMLDEFAAHSKYVEYDFIDPSASDDGELITQTYQELVDKGLQPTDLHVTTNKGSERKIIFPGAIVGYKEKEVALQLLQSQIGVPSDEVLNNSIQSLEYEISNAIRKVTSRNKANIAFIDDYGCLTPAETYSFELLLKEYYSVSRIQIDGQLTSLAEIYEKGTDTVKMRNKYSAIIIAGPNEEVPEKDKFIIDQFIMRGGKVLWLVEPLYVSMDSLQNQPSTYAIGNANNLTDQLFNYGVRLEPQLALDIQCLSIPMTTGMVADRPQIEFFHWPYFPVLTPTEQHPIVKNLNAISTQFISPITTIGVDGVNSTVLLTTSPYSRTEQVPALVSLKSLDAIDPSYYKEKNLPVAVLLEGTFPSLYDNRIPENLMESNLIDFVPISKPTAMVVISDADMVRNQFRAGDGYPLNVGYDQYVDIQFGNPELFLNIMNYLCDDSGLISVRSRELKLRTLDKNKVKSYRTSIVLINMVLPSLIIIICGIIFNMIRKRKYSK